MLLMCHTSISGGLCPSATALDIHPEDRVLPVARRHGRRVGEPRVVGGRQYRAKVAKEGGKLQDEPSNNNNEEDEEEEGGGEQR